MCHKTSQLKAKQTTDSEPLPQPESVGPGSSRWETNADEALEAPRRDRSFTLTFVVFENNGNGGETGVTERSETQWVSRQVKHVNCVCAAELTVYKDEQ